MGIGSDRIYMKEFFQDDGLAIYEQLVWQVASSG